jgi:hypothetical protein
LWFETSSGKKVSQTSSRYTGGGSRRIAIQVAWAKIRDPIKKKKKPKAKSARGVGQVEECLLSKHEVLGSNLNTITNKTTHK